MPRVDPTKNQTELEEARRQEDADNGPSVESIAGQVPPSESPYRPEVSIDANPDHRSTP